MRAGDGAGGESLGHQSRPLFDVQLQVGADLLGIEERAALPDGSRVESTLDQGGFETLAVVRSRYRQAGRVEQSERAAAAEIGNVEPGRLFGANAHDSDIARGALTRLLERGHRAEARHHARSAVVVAS